MKKSDNCHQARYRRALALALASSVMPPISLLEELKCRPCNHGECGND